MLKLMTFIVKLHYFDIMYQAIQNVLTQDIIVTMTEYIAFQQFTPKEHRSEKRCIWCGREEPHNKAHIISRKLTLTSHHCVILKYSVCQSCNSKCGQLESWVLRNSPLGWTRFFQYLSSNKESDTSTIPSYFYADDQHEWLVYRLEGGKLTKTIDNQLILKKDGKLILITNQPESQLEEIRTRVRIGVHTIDVRPSLPDDFSPRALVSQEQVVVIARTQEEIALFTEIVRNTNWREVSKNRVQPKSSLHNRQHFKWSRENWVKFCAKISYETLCLFEGSEYCLKSEFERVRSYVLGGVSGHYREIVFNEHGPLDSRDIPNTQGCIDMTLGQDCPQNFVALLPHISPGMHQAILYEIDGWVCSSVSISGFPACCIVLGGPDTHLRDLYTLAYDNQMDDFDTICLAYDRNRPIIPLAVEGNMKEALVRTYKLRAT